MCMCILSRLPAYTRETKIIGQEKPEYGYSDKSALIAEKLMIVVTGNTVSVIPVSIHLPS